MRLCFWVTFLHHPHSVLVLSLRISSSHPFTYHYYYWKLLFLFFPISIYRILVARLYPSQMTEHELLLCMVREPTASSTFPDFFSILFSLSVSYRFGRKLAFFACLTCEMIGGVGCVFAKDFWVWTLFRMITGVTVPAIYQIPFIICKWTKVIHTSPINLTFPSGA